MALFRSFEDKMVVNNSKMNGNHEFATPGKNACLVFSPEFYAEVVKLTTRLEPRPSSSTRVPDSCPLKPVSEGMTQGELCSAEGNKLNFYSDI